MVKALMKKLADPLVIYVGRQTDGCVYQLPPSSRTRIENKFPHAHVAPSLFIGWKTETDIKRATSSHWRQIVIILTGLTDDQVAQLGGVRICDPLDESVVWESPVSPTRQ